MTSKTRERKFQELCERAGVTYPFGEDDIGIYKLTFHRDHLNTFVVEANDMNRGGRLYLQAIAAYRHVGTNTYVALATKIEYGEHFRAAVREFFSDIDHHDTSPTHRRLLHGIFTSDSVEIEWKESFLE